MECRTKTRAWDVVRIDRSCEDNLTFIPLSRDSHYLAPLDSEAPIFSSGWLNSFEVFSPYLIKSGSFLARLG